MPGLDRRRTVDEFVAEPLVIPFTVIVLDELGHRPAQMTFVEGITRLRHSCLSSAHEALRVSIRVGA